MGSIKENIQLVCQRIEKAALSVGRNPKEIRLVAAVKNQSVGALIEAIEAGITDFGENRVQEAQEHYAALKDKYPQLVWQMIGHLQRNKVKQTLELFDVIETVDSERLALEIEAQAVKKVPVLIEVNTSGESSKNGVPVDLALELVNKISSLSNLEVHGLMTMAPLVNDEKIIRTCFRRLKNLSEQIKQLNLPNVVMKNLSMGMSSDFELAIAEGSNIIRIGQAIFGARGG